MTDIVQYAIDLLRGVRGVLPPRSGGTGATSGQQRLVLPCANNTGGTLPYGTAVQYTHGSQDQRITATADAGSRKVIGSVVGYFDNDGIVVEGADAIDGALAAVQTAGLAPFLIDGDVTRGEYAYTAATDGAITSSATLDEAAFGLVTETAIVANGDTMTLVLIPLLAGASVAGVSAHDDLTGVTADQHHAEVHDADGADHAFPGDPSLYLDGSGVFSDPSAGGGAGPGYTRVIDEDGTSLAGWTVIAGTWSSDGTNIKQTSTAASFARAYYTTKLRLVPATIRWEFRFDAGGAGDDYAGISFGTTGANGGAAVRPEIVSGVSQLRIEADDGAGTTDLYSAGDGVPTWVRGTWYAVEVMFDGFTTTIWVDGTLIGTNRVLLPASRLYNYFRLLTHSAAADFRNITVDTLDTS